MRTALTEIIVRRDGPISSKLVRLTRKGERCYRELDVQLISIASTL